MNYFDNHFLFSETYINDYIKSNSNKNKQNDSLKNTFNAIKEWHEPFADGDYSDEDWVEEFIDLTLDVLRFKKKTDDRVRILYTNAITTDEKPVASCYVLEKNEDLDCKVKGNYNAYKAVNTAKNNNLEWAMLTNGYRWRIYNTKNVSCYENYLEVDIEESINNLKEPDAAFKLFYVFFNVKTYYKTENGELEIENIKDLSDKKAETIENFLRGKVEEILKDLCYGLKENMNFITYEEQDRKNIYNDAVILLFRLLFIGYAESRKLLPCSNEDTEYVKNSFFTICNDAKEMLNSGKAYEIKDGFEFWNRIDEYLRIYVDKTYDGGLFENFDKPVLNNYKITNGYLIKCLAEMTYYVDKKTGMYNEAIEYKDLSVRNLGSIYEGLLEYNLFIAKERMVMRKSKGKVTYIEASKTTLKRSDESNIIEAGGIYLSQDALERKDTGSYYTPEDVVEYIVTNTVGKKIKELKADLNEILKEKKELMLIEPSLGIKKSIQKEIDDITLQYIENNILKLSIIDSAMGSGHFLVNAAYNVANSIVEIICENDWINEDIPIDIAYWKRKVVENCIYGIDINKLAVYLARVSLWLISASNDKALSFIDHHLKEGNSIIGTDREHVEIKENNNRMISWFDVDYMEFMGGILSKYKELKNISGNSKDEVEKQKQLYREIEEDLRLVKMKYDFYLASQYNGGIKDKDDYAILMRSNDIGSFETEEINELLKIAKEKKFFHWELEFPEVMLEGGFDIIIGNPPYVEVSDLEYNRSLQPLEFYTKECGNLYVYFIELAKRVSKKDSKISMIIPLAMFSTPRMIKAQKFVNDNYNRKQIAFFDVRPGTIFKNALVFSAIFAFENVEDNNEKGIYTTKLIKWYSSERKRLFDDINYTKISNDKIIRKFSIPKISNYIENSILKKIISKKNQLNQFVDDKTDNKVLYGYGGRNWVKAMDFFPVFKKNGQETTSTGDRYISFKENIDIRLIVAIFNSTVFYWYYLIYSDCRNKTKTSMLDFYTDIYDMNDTIKQNLINLEIELMRDYKNNSIKKICNYSTGIVEYDEFYPKKSKDIIDKIDKELGRYFEFTSEEVDYLINYNIRFRIECEE
ncbi:Eco57I restriction-modification methylase domain-containing protein [Clostridium butyricum]|uniref:Eco57I restriction-modification methylase domain-containing protein n=1 Tax=Clostridium butyricum TaxID=1492 RepID=UPI001CA8A29F|nr:Eco57I restriction-modification methylase domain-containing protein [Clostridium butyricum]MBZ0312411.1 Eco57I restriction-modification methylase domain-containing protein [Clostridium butyricum]